MDLDYDKLDRLRRHHPAWRLLRSDHAPLIASLLHRAFIAPNQRLLMQSERVWTLDLDGRNNLLNRFFAAATRDLSITGEFAHFGTDIAQLRKRLRSRDVEIWNGFPPFAAIRVRAARRDAECRSG